MLSQALALHPVPMESPFPAVLRRFDTHLDVVGRAEKTRRKYRYELLRWWTDYLFATERAWDDVEPGHVEEYLGGLPAKGSKRGDALRSLRAFYSWAQADGQVELDPTAHIPIPRPKYGPAPDLSDADLRRLLRAAFHHEPRRGWAIMLCYVTGARVGSLVAVRPCDVHLGPDARLDLLEAKGGRPYSVPLERAGVIAARHLLKCNIPCRTSTANVALRDQSGKVQFDGSDSSTSSEAPKSEPRLIGVGAERFRQWVHAAEQDAGLGRVWPHLLRHAFLTRVAHAEGVSPEEVRKLANWADLSQWPRYIAGSDRLARQAVGGILGGRSRT